jgi:8-oxo-dGTP pyrophosphatase MutT (NUDIX family)
MSASLRDRLQSLLSEPPSTPPLAGDLPEIREDAAAPAAVLLAITDRKEPGLILTLRRDDMRTHAGQIAFPGGRIEEGESAISAALREAEEELRLTRSLVDPVGCLDRYRTVTGFVVTPVVAAIPPDLPLVPHEHEVADWFEAPLAFLLDPQNHRRETAVFGGLERSYWTIQWQDRRIWGATAAIIINLTRRLQWR